MPDNQFSVAAKKRKAQITTGTSTTANKRSPSRRGTRHVGGYFSPEVLKQLRQIALEEDSYIQRLLAESIDMLFQSRKRPTIATLDKA